MKYIFIVLFAVLAGIMVGYAILNFINDQYIAFGIQLMLALWNATNMIKAIFDKW